MSLAQQPESNVRQLCRRFGISPTAGYKWLNRYKQGGASALADQSRRPRKSPRLTAAQVETRVVELRQAHPVWGARKLRRRLQDLGQTGLPATSTITGILHRHGLISPAQSQAATPWQRFERAAPNELWQVDYKGDFALRQGRCHALGLLDDHSRYNILLAACSDQQRATVQGHLQAAFERYGLPDTILWDNGGPWGGSGPEFTGLEVWVMRLGVRVSHGRPYHPQTQGKEERFHRTLQAEVLARGGWTDCPQVQQAFDQWRVVYNTERPHQALALATPASRYQPSQRSYPATLPEIGYAPGVAVRRVDVNGHLYYQGRKWKIGRAFVHQPVGLRPTATDGLMEVIFLTQVIKELDLRQKQNPLVP